MFNESDLLLIYEALEDKLICIHASLICEKNPFDAVIKRTKQSAITKLMAKVMLLVKYQ